VVVKRRIPKMVTERQKKPHRHAEVGRSADRWVVYYPDPGWVDCGPLCAGCDLNPSHRNQRWIKADQDHDTLARAMDYARWLGYEEVRVR
jgi:hypothetical protein